MIISLCFLSLLSRTGKVCILLLTCQKFSLTKITQHISAIFVYYSLKVLIL